MLLVTSLRYDNGVRVSEKCRIRNALSHGDACILTSGRCLKRA
jgi:hypothetical protein